MVFGVRYAQDVSNMPLKKLNVVFAGAWPAPCFQIIMDWTPLTSISIQVLTVTALPLPALWCLLYTNILFYLKPPWVRWLSQRKGFFGPTTEKLRLGDSESVCVSEIVFLFFFNPILTSEIFRFVWYPNAGGVITKSGAILGAGCPSLLEIT